MVKLLPVSFSEVTNDVKTILFDKPVEFSISCLGRVYYVENEDLNLLFMRDTQEAAIAAAYSGLFTLFSNSNFDNSSSDIIERRNAFISKCEIILH